MTISMYCLHVCMYVYVCVCVYVCMYVCICLCMYCFDLFFVVVVFKTMNQFTGIEKIIV